ncbi:MULTISPECIES: DMT family transporter [Kitasatospora]|uniref:DMT family transporter n=1 Tax=Kitasatospora TaxID=2063 RepID=UPI000C70423C|nr:DMT family transporter [Kitasatospora sp. GP30]MDH6142672.1 drug/metabolite transporter (DMT)-like permease [Kitasatospora sp. GP30]
MDLPTTPAGNRFDRLDTKAVAAAAVAVLLWASAFVAIRTAAKHFGPGELALGRLVVGSVALLAVWALRREGLPRGGAWPGIVVSGLLWFGLYMVALNWGEQKVDAGTAAMVVNIGPLVIALLGGLALKEGFPRGLLAGMAVSFAGAVVVGISSSGSGHGSSVLGVLLCLLAALLYAGGVVAQKPALRHGTALQVTAFGCLIGTLACLPFAPSLLHQVHRAPLSADLDLVYLGLFPTALAFGVWAYALSRSTAGRMGATTYAVPALVVLMSWAALGEVPGLLTLLGGCLCLGGVALSRRRS